MYGDNLDTMSLAQRVRRVVGTARRFRARTRGERFDLIHLNTAFDQVDGVPRHVHVRGAGPPGRACLPQVARLESHDPDLGTSRLSVWWRDACSAGPPRSASSRRRSGRTSSPQASRRRSCTSSSTPCRRRQSRAAREVFLSAHELPAETPLLLFISRLVPTKGLLDVVRACGILRDRGQTFTLCCVGDGPAREEAETEAARLGLGGSARFFGYLPESEASGFYRYCDVLVFPTFHAEGLPIVLLNALASGLPIVTTRTRAAVDYLSEPETCLWVEPHDPEQVADRVAELLDDDALRAAIGGRARERARAFDPANVAGEYLDLYRQIVAPRPAADGSVPAVEPEAEARS